MVDQIARNYLIGIWGGANYLDVLLYEEVCKYPASIIIVFLKAVFLIR